MRSVLTGFVAVAALGWSSSAVGGELLILHADAAVRIGAGTGEARILGDEWATPLTNAELAGKRGGVRGLSFAVHFEGMVDGQQGEGLLHLIGPDGVIVPGDLPNPGATAGSDVSSFIGELGPFQGIGQWAIVNGDGNNVTNSLTVNIFVTDGSGSTTTFADVLSLIDVTGL